MRILNLLDSIDQLQLSYELNEMLKEDLGVYKIGELLRTPCKKIFGEIEEHFKENSNKFKNEIRSKVHGADLYFYDEHNGMQYVRIDDDTPIELLRLPAGVHGRIKATRPNIKTLKDLADSDFQDLNRCLGVGKGKMEIMVAYLNRFGYHMVNEKCNMQEEKEELAAKGEILLEDVGFRDYLLGKLNRFNIYTLRQLLSLEESIYEIPGIGAKRSKDIDYILGELGLKVGDPYPEEGPTSTIVHISQMRATNSKVAELIKEKQNLMEQYERLLAEREELQRISHALDDKILQYAEKIKNERAKKHE